MKIEQGDVSVILCTYSEARWQDLVAAVRSVQEQTLQPCEIIVVVDHNEALLQRVREELPQVTVVENGESQGLSGARNSGIAASHGHIVAFMDEDAFAARDWLERLSAHYADDHVLGVGGSIQPMWTRGRPRWLPAEFDWVVGCSYVGMPTSAAPVRNLIGCNMSFRRCLFDAIGGFTNGVGRIGTLPVGCEETEFCIRAHRRWPEGRFLYDPSACVYHRIPQARQRWRYFLSRCYSEGLSKALVSRLVGANEALASERTYAYHVLPRAVVRGFAGMLKGNITGLAVAVSIVVGFATTALGYVVGTLRGETLPSPQEPSFSPARVLEIDLDQPLPIVSAQDSQGNTVYQRAVVLVRLHTYPLGIVEIPLSERGLAQEDFSRAIWSALREEINTHLRHDGLKPVSELSGDGISSLGEPLCRQGRQRLLSNPPAVSIVVATHNRTESLRRALDSLLSIEYKAVEIIVVDNAPTSNATAELIREYSGRSIPVRYLREDVPGLAIAHNRGLSQVNSPYVAFTDDDVVVDKYWLAELILGFSAGDRVACVTGMILPAELETPPQQWIEEFGGFTKGFTRRVFDLSRNRPGNPLYPYTAGAFGSGASMAFRTSVLRDLGGFDPALGAGSEGVGGDDLAAFFDVISAGYQLVYQPSAVLHHWHRRDYPGLIRQANGYGVGLTAFLTKTLIDRPLRIFEVISKLPSGIHYLVDPLSPKNRKKHSDYPKALTRVERQGMLRGPLAYVRSRRRMKRLLRSARDPGRGSATQSAFARESRRP